MNARPLLPPGSPRRPPPARPADRHGRATAPAWKREARPLDIAPPGCPGSAHDAWQTGAVSPKPLIRKATAAANPAARAIGHAVFAIGRPNEAWRAVLSLSLQIIEGKGKEGGAEGQHEAGPNATRRDCFAIGDRHRRFPTPSVAARRHAWRVAGDGTRNPFGTRTCR